jgi:beta-lactamase superfamily II metal-dependent hydrolase
MNKLTMFIHVFPALNGDSILIDVLETRLLIDGGYVNTFNTHLKPALAELKAKGKSISHLIVTHIDGDHISGINRLVMGNTASAIILIDNIWHNAYRHIQPHAVASSVLATFNGKSLDAFDRKPSVKEIVPGVKEIGAEQGSALATYIARDGYAWNSAFDSKAVCIENAAIINISPEIILRLLSPSKEKLTRLHKIWQKELYLLGYAVKGDDTRFDDAFELVLAQEKESKIAVEKNISHGVVDLEELAAAEFPEDNTATNGSSIAFVLEAGEKKILMLGDAHPSLIVEQLKKQYPQGPFPIKFDLIKLSHHGSVHNTSRELLEIIDSTAYVFSTNGKIHNHPHLETIARIVTRPTNNQKTLYFNYPIAIIPTIDNIKWKTKYNYNIVISDGDKPLKIDL